MNVEAERRLYVGQLYADTTPPTRRNAEQRSAALILALDLLEATPPYKPKYSVTVGKWTVTAHFSTEALVLQYEVQALINKLNAS